MRRVVALLLGMLVLGAGVGVTSAAFTAQTSTAGSTFSTAASFGGARVASGTYTGTGVDNRAITGLPFQPDVVIVKATTTAQVGVVRTSTMTGDLSKVLDGATAAAANRIQSLAATSFTVGTDATVNTNGTVYRWVAFKALDGRLELGTYTGTGAARSIDTVGVSPEFLMVLSTGATRVVQRSATMGTSYPLGASSAIAGAVTALDDEGFDLGTAPEVNTAGTTYHYLAWNAAPGYMSVGSYVGTGADNRSITGPGFRPDWAVVRADTQGTACDVTAQRSQAAAGDVTDYFTARVSDADRVQALEAAGFQLGAGCEANTAARTYHWMAFRDETGAVVGCSASGTQTVTATADTWADQAAPTTNKATDTLVRVRTGSSANRRAYVSFALPAVPAGCSVIGAKLRVYARTPASGRTLRAQRVTAAWTEAGVTWNAQPASTTTGQASAASLAAAGWMEWTMTAAVQTMYSSGNFGFLVRDASESAGTAVEQLLDSREGANDPQLQVTFG